MILVKVFSDKMALDLEKAEKLVRFARKTIEHYLSKGERIKVPEDIEREFSDKAGVFVTLTTFDTSSLRGCIGFPEPTMPLALAVRDAAISAAVSDPRFPPLSKDELGNVTVEVSVLSKPVLIRAKRRSDIPSQIEIGRDGLIVRKGIFSGLLLPQVAVEYNMSAEEFVSETCRKAGLPFDSWLDEGTEVYKFQAEVFGEETPKGRVIRKL